MPALPLLLAAALAASPAPISVGLHALLFSLPAINEDAAMDAVGRSQVGLSDFVGMDPPRKSRAVVLHFFDREWRSGNRFSRPGPATFRQPGRAGTGHQHRHERHGRPLDLAPSQKLGFPVLRDNHQVVRGRYGIEKLPLTVVVDRWLRVRDWPAPGRRTGSRAAGRAGATDRPVASAQPPSATPRRGRS